MNILKTIFPSCCIACEREGSLLCTTCTRTLTLLEQSCLYCDRPSYYGQTCSTCRQEDHIDGHYSCFGYGHVIRACINALKYQGVQSLGVFLGKKIGLALCDHPVVSSPPMSIIPVPSHRRKHYFIRGYTQTVGVAEGVQKILGGTVSHSLSKTRYTRSQVGTGRSTRLSSIQGSFGVHENDDMSSTIIIVDDITTTGATLRETGKILRQHYPTQQIWGVSLARNK